MTRHTNARLATVLLLNATTDLAQRQAEQVRADAAERDELVRQAQAEQQRREAEERAERRRRAAPRLREQDGAVLGWAIFLVVTLIGPYLLGHFVLRETWLLAPDPGVYDGAVRGLGDHFVPDYLAGVAAVTALTAAFLLLRPWHHRVRSVVLGWVLVVGLIAFLLPAVDNRWRDSERTSIGKLATTAYPFGERYYTCDSYAYQISWQRGGTEVWQIYLAQEAGFPGRACNRVEVYNGWRRVGQFTTRDGDTFRPGSWNNTDISRGGFHLTTIWVSVHTARNGNLRFSLDGAVRNEFMLNY